METKDLFDQVFKRWEVLLSAWNFYLVVAFALLVFFALSHTARTERKVLCLFAVGWAFFAWTHLLGLLYMIKQWAAVAGVLKDRLSASEADKGVVDRITGAGMIEAPEAVWIVPFHLLLDAFVLYGMWVLCGTRRANGDTTAFPPQSTPLPGPKQE